MRSGLTTYAALSNSYYIISSYMDSDKIRDQTGVSASKQIFNFISNQNRIEALSAQKLTAIIWSERRHSASELIKLGDWRQNTSHSSLHQDFPCSASVIWPLQSVLLLYNTNGDIWTSVCILSFVFFMYKRINFIFAPLTCIWSRGKNKTFSVQSLGGRRFTIYWCGNTEIWN